MAKNNVWISVSDLMTGLMVIFLFVSVAYMLETQNTSVALKEYVDHRTELHDSLVHNIKQKESWGMSIDSTLSIRFSKAEVLFVTGQPDMQPSFKEILKEFLPQYFDVLLKCKAKEDIIEVRIEGHTDPKGGYKGIEDPYLANVVLSQERAYNVLAYYRTLPQYQSLSQEDRDLLEFWITANGLSYGHSLNNKGDLTHYATSQSDKVISYDRSRRVEFKVIMKNEDIVKEFVEKINKD